MPHEANPVRVIAPSFLAHMR